MCVDKNNAWFGVLYGSGGGISIKGLTPPWVKEGVL